ncbi:MAG TPA: tRNA (adenosine(37)-N6)-dimethylallyltransferase MiaA [Candidatus Krumholzibacteria bacterium]
MSHPPNADARIRAVAIMGATATGKSALAISLAEAFDGEIISMDSRQAYRGLDIGTGKVSRDDRARVPHHLIDILDVSEYGSAGRHVVATETAIRDIAARGRVPILAGGTGLYFRALFGGLVAVVIPRDELEKIRSTFAGRETPELHAELARFDPARAATLSVNDRVRVTRALELIAYTGTPVSDLYAQPRTGAEDVVYLKLVLSMPRALLRQRIAERTKQLFDAGWVDEVRGLLARQTPLDAPGMRSLGYGTIAAALVAGTDPQGCLGAVTTATHQYAKRQETFFRSEKDAVWIDVSQPGATARAHELAGGFLRGDALNNNLTQSR